MDVSTTHLVELGPLGRLRDDSVDFCLVLCKPADSQ